MSIINDALKKVQANLKTTHPPAKPQPVDESSNKIFISTPVSQEKDLKETHISPQPIPRETPTAQHPSSSQNISFFILFVLAAGIGFGIYLSTTLHHNSSQPQTNPMIEQRTSSLPTKIKIPGADMAVSANTPAVTPLILKGVAFDKAQQGTALINDRIYKTGDVVEGKTIVSITPDGVELTENGETTKLLVR